MSLRRGVSLTFIIAISCMFWFSYSVVASEEKFVETQQEEQSLVYYRLHEAEEGKSIPASIFVKEEKILTFTQSAGGLSPRERAAILADKLKVFVENNGNPEKIYPGYRNGIAVGTYEDETLFTADVKSARSSDMSVSQLALYWTNSIRKVLGASELLNDFELFKLIAKNSDGGSGYLETGVASWYGGHFHGRRAADGSAYNMNKFTAAHKTLPFGSIVKVTNLRNNNSCVVKITDRGPFIEGRIIDLSRVAAEEIGMLGSGVSKVKIEVLGRV